MYCCTQSGNKVHIYRLRSCITRYVLNIERRIILGILNLLRKLIFIFQVVLVLEESGKLNFFFESGLSTLATFFLKVGCLP